MTSRFLSSLFIGGYISGMSLSITGAVLFNRFSEDFENPKKNPNIYLGRETPGQIAGLFISYYLNRIKVNPKIIGFISASLLPVAVCSELYIGRCKEEYILPLIICSSVSKSIAFTGIIGPHSLAMVKLSGSELANFSVRSVSCTSVGATFGIIEGLMIKDMKWSNEVAMCGGILYPFVLLRCWNRIL